MLVGKRVRQFRKAKGLTQQQLGQLAGLYHTTISELERGDTEPHIATLQRIASALNISVTQLLTDNDDPSAS